MKIITDRLLLTIILAAYLIVGGLFAVLTPDWQAPDETAHYNYIRQFAQNGAFPVIEMGDWQQEYQERLMSARFAPELLDRLETIQYEDHQPPLYYVMAAPIYSLSGGGLIALRLFSVLIGAGVVWCAYRISRVLLPARPGIAPACALFTAFLPQHIAMLSAVNNDGLAEFLIGLTLLATVIYLKHGTVRPWQLGLLVGLIFVTKSTGYFLAGVVPLAIFLHWWRYEEIGPTRVRTRWHWSLLLRTLLLFFIPALLLGGLWWLRNISVYGFPDFLGLRAHDMVVADQLRSAERIADVGFRQYLNEILQITFNSFWGQFGWMALPLQAWMYRVFQVVLLVVIVGLLVDVFVLRRRIPADENSSGQRSAWIILWLTMTLAVLAFVYYNSEFYQPQGRYLFPGLIPFALLMALGLDGWRRWLLARFTWAQWLPAAIYALLIPLDVYLIIRVIRPLLLP